jgi:hypothetical protein
MIKNELTMQKTRKFLCSKEKRKFKKLKSFLKGKLTSINLTIIAFQLPQFKKQ